VQLERQTEVGNAQVEILQRIVVALLVDPLLAVHNNLASLVAREALTRTAGDSFCWDPRTDFDLGPD
jgi:hypothetical protein